jgi:hypothetical protein
MQVHALHDLSWTTDPSIVPYSAPLDICSPSGGVHLLTLRIRQILRDTPGFSHALNEPRIGITVLCKGKIPGGALVWVRQEPARITAAAPAYIASIMTADYQTLFDAAVDLTPPDQLKRETFEARHAALHAAEADNAVELRLKALTDAASKELLRMQDAEIRSMCEEYLRPELVAAEEDHRASHDAAECALRIWHLLNYACGRRQMSPEDRAHDGERRKQFRSTRPRL